MAAVLVERVGIEICQGDWYHAEKEITKAAESDPFAALQYALISVNRFVLSGDNSLIKQCCDRLRKAEDLCHKQSHSDHSDLAHETDDFRSWSQRLTLSSKFSSPWCHSTMKEELSPKAQSQLAAWRKSCGSLALAHLLRGVVLLIQRPTSFMKVAKAVLAIRSSWNLCRSIHLSTILDTEEYIEASAVAILVKGIFSLLLGKVPHAFHTVLKGIGFDVDPVEGIGMLRKAQKSKDLEIRMLAVSFEVLHYLLMAQQEYDDNCVKNMQMALHVSEEFNKKHPEFLLSSWIHSHILRRQGATNDAVVLIDKVSLVVKQQAAASHGQYSNYRLRFDRAMLHFIAKDYKEAVHLLKPLVHAGSTFGAKILADIVISSSYALLGQEAAAEKQLELLSVVDESEWGKVDKSLMKKSSTLLNRPHKSLVAYEILYLFGHMKAHSPRMAEQPEDALSWLDTTLRELETIATETGISPMKLASIELSKAVPLEKAEELCVTMLIRGAIFAVKSEFEAAEKILQTLLNAIDKNKALAFEDDYMVGWALYELGSICLSTGDMKTAKVHFSSANKLCRKHHSASFSHMLQYKCTGALRAIKESCKKA